MLVEKRKEKAHIKVWCIFCGYAKKYQEEYTIEKTCPKCGREGIEFELSSGK